MPTKHTRKRNAEGGTYNLGPDDVAKPLPSFDNSAKNAKKRAEAQAGKKKQKRKREKIEGYGEDDTPRRFARMIHQRENPNNRRSGLDNGEKRKKQKVQNGEGGATAAPVPAPVVEKPKFEVPKILPGERLADYSARVDQALPMAGLNHKGKKVEGMKERQTRKEKKMHKMYDQWRLEEAKRKEKLEEQQELEEEEEEEKQAEHGGQDIRLPQGKRAKRRSMIGEAADKDDDPWKVLNDRREAPKGLHDVVQAPPTLKPVREKFKVRNGAKVDVANVPTASGSLKRREELGETRRDIIERYRAMMRQNKESA